MVRAGRGRCNRRGAETGLIGEYAARAAPTHGGQHRSDDGTADAARDRIKREGHAEHLRDAGWHGLKVGADDDNRDQEVEGGHDRHDDARDETDAADAAHEDAERHDCDDAADEPRRDAVAARERCRDRVGLRHVADAEGGKHDKEREQERKRAADVLVLDAVLHRVHRAAGHLADAVRLAVLDGQDRLTILRREAKGRADPHPDERTRAAKDHGRCDTDDVARADCRRQRRHERLERRDITGVLVALREDHVDRIAEIAPRQELQAHRQENARADEQYQHDGAPDKIVDIRQQLR